MSKSFEKYQKRRLRSSRFSVIISIALVLFMLGLLGLLILNTKKVADYFKEQAAITLYLNDMATEKNIAKLQENIKKEPFTKAIKFTSKEEAAEIYKKENGEDFMNFLGYNPLQNSIDIFVKADYVTPEKMEEIARLYESNMYVSDISYDKPLIDLLTKNVRKLSYFILIFSAISTLIVVVLINGSIRLSIYSKRFIIKTMQMVGATKGFIRRPFIWESVKLGIIGGIIALIALGGVLFYLKKRFPEFDFTGDKLALGIIFGGVFIIGILITWLSTFFATQRFLNLRTDELYY